MDISGRGSSEVMPPGRAYSFKSTGEGYDFDDAKEFLKAFATNAGITLKYTFESGDNLHHVLESIFKAIGVALGKACEINPRRKGIPSTKGKL